MSDNINPSYPYIPAGVYHLLSESERTEWFQRYPFTPNKRMRETDLEADINPLYETEAPETDHPAQNQPVQVPVVQVPTFIYNPDLNPLIKSGHFSKTKPVAHPRKFNTFAGRSYIPILDARSILQRDWRFSKILGAQINGVSVPAKSYAQLRNHMLSVYDRKVRIMGSEMPYYPNGLAVRGVGSKQIILAIVRLTKMISSRTCLRIQLRDGQVVSLNIS